MKWIKATLIPIGLIVLIFLIAHAGRVKHVNYYATYGWTAAEMTQIVIDSSTTTGYQMKRRTMTIPIGTQDAGIDTIWTQLFTVPAGQTYTVTEMILSAHTEGDEATDTLHCSVLYYLGTAKATLDTCVLQFCVDDDSTIVYADTIYTMTLVDSVFTAGDIVTCWWMGPGGAMTEGEGAAITIEFIIDE